LIKLVQVADFGIRYIGIAVHTIDFKRERSYKTVLDS
jgi:hypothetical protein